MCTSRRIALLSTLLLALLLSVACGGQTQLEPTVSPAEPTAVAQAPQMGPITPFDAPEVRDLSPTSEVVPNCDGVTSPVVKHPSMTVGSSHTVEWQVGGSVGIGVTIGGGVVPGGVDLQTTLEGHVANDLTNSIQQSNAWDLPADPGTIMEYTIMWREVWQPAYLDVTFMDPEPKIIRIDVKYRTGVQSDIVGSKATPCVPEATPGVTLTLSPTPDNGPSPTITVTPTPTESGIAIIPPATTIGQAETGGACGPEAFDTLQTANPLFQRPEGMLSGYLSSDPATVQLADGTQMRFDTQFVLVVEDMPQVQVLGVGTKPSGEANTFGCWFLAADSQFAEEGARRDLKIKTDAGNRAVLYRVSSAGFEPMNP